MVEDSGQEIPLVEVFGQQNWCSERIEAYLSEFDHLNFIGSGINVKVTPFSAKNYEVFRSYVEKRINEIARVPDLFVYIGEDMSRNECDGAVMTFHPNFVATASVFYGSVMGKVDKYFA